MNWFKSIFYLPILVVLSHTVMLSAAQENKRVKTIYPAASVILMDAYRYLGSLDQFSLDAVTTNDGIYRNRMMQNKMVVEYTHKIQVDLQRPDKLRVHSVGDIKNRMMYLSDTHFTVYDPVTNFYGEVEVPKTIDAALDHLFERFNLKTPLANLLYTDLDKRLAPTNKGFYFGVVGIDGQPCHYIGFTNDKRELQVWIEKSDTPLIRKFVIIDKSVAYYPRSSTVIHWNLKPHLKEKHFLFQPPKGAANISIAPVSSKEKE